MDKLCQLCAHLTTCAPECKSVSRNSDLQICMEACAKMCHCCVNMIQSQRMHPDLVHSLHTVCTWCAEGCDRLQVGTMRPSCLHFSRCCAGIVQECKRHMRSPSSPECVIQRCSHDDIDTLCRCCQTFVTAGICRKPEALVEKQLDHEQLADAEACLHFCRCLQFMCRNCPENVDCGMVHHCRRLCKECASCGFCSEQAAQCVQACGMVCGDDPQSSTPQARGGLQDALSRFFAMFQQQAAR